MLVYRLNGGKCASEVGAAIPGDSGDAMGIGASRKLARMKIQRRNAWQEKFKLSRKPTNVGHVKTIRFLTPVVSSSSIEPLAKRPIETFGKKPTDVVYVDGLKKDSQWSYDGSFHQAIMRIQVIAQFFGVLPVINITSKNPSHMKFSWLSLRTIYSIIIVIVTGFQAAITVYHSFSSKIEFAKTVPVIFYGSNFYVIFAFIMLARKWPDLMEAWKRSETCFNGFQTTLEKRYLRRRIAIIAITVCVLSLTEHFLSLATLVHWAKVCPDKDDYLTAIFKQEFTQLFSITSYSLEKAIVAQFINTICTFVWSYMDCFVMIVSVGLSTGFKKINSELVAYKGKAMSEDFWEAHRTAYRGMCDLCEFVDNHINRITLVCFSNNLFFICVQLLNSLNPKDSLTHTIYFWFSLIFLIARTLAVSLYAAEVNEEAKVPIHVLRVVPRESWFLEVKRFYEEVTNDTTALSGMKFFFLTRRLVLSVAGTIVTYELVLLQFHQDEKLENKDPCGPLVMA